MQDMEMHWVPVQTFALLAENRFLELPKQKHWNAKTGDSFFVYCDDPKFGYVITLTDETETGFIVERW